MGYICPVCHTENPYALQRCRACGTIVRSGYLIRERRTGRLLARRYATAPRTTLRSIPRAIHWPANRLRTVSGWLLLISLLMLAPAAITDDPARIPNASAVIAMYTGNADPAAHENALHLLRHTDQIAAQMNLHASAIDDSIASMSLRQQHLTERFTQHTAAAQDDRMLLQRSADRLSEAAARSENLANEIDRNLSDRNIPDLPGLLNALIRLYQ